MSVTHPSSKVARPTRGPSTRPVGADRDQRSPRRFWYPPDDQLVEMVKEAGGVGKTVATELGMPNHVFCHYLMRRPELHARIKKLRRDLKAAQPIKRCAVDGCESPARGRGWCVKHYQRWQAHGTTDYTPPTIHERFWSKVDKDGAVPDHAPQLGSCWEWTGSRDGRGYGSFNAGGYTAKAYRWAWEDEYGPVPDGLVLDHLCWNTPCVRPGHLESVTHQENCARGERPRRTHCPKGHEYTPENTKRGKLGRSCRECHRASMRGRRPSKRIEPGIAERRLAAGGTVFDIDWQENKRRRHKVVRGTLADARAELARRRATP